MTVYYIAGKPGFLGNKMTGVVHDEQLYKKLVMPSNDCLRKSEFAAMLSRYTAFCPMPVGTCWKGNVQIQSLQAGDGRNQN